MLQENYHYYDIDVDMRLTTIIFQNDVFSSFGTNLKGSASRLTRMAKQGDTVAVLKVAGICIGAGILLYIILGWIF
jgi:blocked-early-in-transport protein 1